MFGILVFSKSKTLEYLSDYTAAKNYGKINFINALFIVAKITEISELMIENNLGTNLVNVYEIKKIDTDYYEE